MPSTGDAPRVLVAIPAYNEAATIRDVVTQVRTHAPSFDVLVIDDGSTDGTGGLLALTGARVAPHLCNLGYGRAIQTALRYADRAGYEAVITFDADSQHRAEDLLKIFDAFMAGSFDLLIGSRFVQHRNYAGAPLARRVGMRLFSVLLRLVTGHRVYDTSSGLRVVRRRAFAVLSQRPMVDFHAEALVYLVLSGYSVGEFPIAVDERRHGKSMYGIASVIAYPLKVLFLVVVSAVDAQRAAAKASSV